MAKHYSTWPKWPADDESRTLANEAQRERCRIAMQKLRAKRKAEGAIVDREPGPAMTKLAREAFERWFEQLTRRYPRGYSFDPDRGAGVDTLVEDFEKFAYRHYGEDAKITIGVRGMTQLLRSRGVSVLRRRGNVNDPYPTSCAMGYWPNWPDKLRK